MKKLLWIGLVLVVLLFGLILALPWFVPLDPVREKIESSVNANLQGTFTLDHVQLSTFPWIGVELNGILIKNSSEFKESEFVRIQDTAVAVKLLDLLQGKIVGTITIDKPIIRMESKKGGPSNLDTLFKPKSETAAKPKPEKTNSDKEPSAIQNKISNMIQEMQFQTLSIQDGELRTIEYGPKGDRIGGIDISHLNVELNDLAPKGTIPTKISLAFFNSDKPDILFEGILKTDLDLKNQTKHQIEIASSTLSINEITTQIAGTILKKAEQSAQVDLTVESNGISLGRLGKNIPPVKDSIPKDLEGDLSFSSHIKGPADKITAEFSTTSNRIATEKGQKLLIENLKTKGLYTPDQFWLKSMTLDAYQGKMDAQGTITFAKSKGKESRGDFLNFNMNAKDLDLRTITNAFTEHKDLIYGPLSLNVSLSGYPNDPNLPKDSKSMVPLWVNSSGKMKIGGGKIVTLNILGDTLTALLKIAPIQPETKKMFEKVQWNLFNADFRTQGGSLFLEPLTIDYGTSVVTAKGEKDPEDKLDFGGSILLRPETVKKLGAQFAPIQNKDGSITLPIRIRGKLSKPITYIDVTKLVGAAAKKQVEEMVPDQVKKDVESVKGLIKGVIPPKKEKAAQ